MPSNRILYRSLVIAALVLAVAGTSGCGWFRKGSPLYRESAENRPLEVPPDLDRPNTEGAMKVPPGGGSVSRSSLTTQAPASASNSGFMVAGERDAVFERVGTALAGIEGVTVVTRAQLLGSYDIDYQGSKFLVRVAKADTGSYVSAVDPRGVPATDEAPVQLMTALKAALGG
jgi:uncharacterized lipoprotein